MRSLAAAMVAGLMVAGCGSVPVDRRVTELAHARIGSSGDCRQAAIAIFWPAYKTNVPLYACSGQSRGWCVLVSPDRRSVTDVTRFMYQALRGDEAGWAVRPACLRWRGVERFQAPGGGPAVAPLPARLYRR